MKILALLMLVSSVAAADNTVSLYNPTGQPMLVALGDDAGKIDALVGHGKTGVVRCYQENDGYTGVSGAADGPIVGCYVAITRDGKLVAPPAKTQWSLAHLFPLPDASLTIDEAKTGELTLTIGRGVANAIGLWVDCADKRGDLRCRQNSGMLGKFGWEVAFTITKGGGVKLATW